MFVWHWVQQHRLLTVMVLALVIVSSAGGTAWALVFRTVSSPVGLREALRMYRKEQTGKVLASLRDRLPAPGVYPYRTSGGEGLSLMGVERSFPSTTSMVVGGGNCATVSWVPITQHTETTTVVHAPGGALTVPEFVTDESIAGTSTHVDRPLPVVGLPAASGGTPGAALARHVLTVQPGREGRPVRAGARASDRAVGGRAVAVEHTRVTLTFTGRRSRAPTRSTSGSSRAAASSCASTSRWAWPRVASATPRPWRRPSPRSTRRADVQAH